MKFHLTGFGPFRDVVANPTQDIIYVLESMKKNGVIDPSDVDIESL
ncbi:MAG: hypothetical protein V2I33_20200 [Kangiellaceae bacterium]|jgi:pyrrolidone-carboxylate peptidase|nr:hypothetical protein [Kangiellaceae bacterium]